MGQRWDKLRGTTSPVFGVGRGSAGNKSFQFNVRDANPPEIRWNDTLGGLEFTEDGSHYFPYGTQFMSAVFASMSEGAFGYLAVTGSLYRTDASDILKSRLVGVHVGVSGRAMVTGVVPSAVFTATSDTPTLNTPVFLARADDDMGAGAGKVTTYAPSTGIVAEVGLVVGVDALTFPITRRASVLLQVKRIVRRNP